MWFVCISVLFGRIQSIGKAAQVRVRCLREGYTKDAFLVLLGCRCVCVCVWCFFLSGFINQKLNHDSICCRFRPCGLNFMIGPIWSSAYSLGVEQMSESVIDRTLSDILSRPPCISVTFRGLRVSRALLIKLCVVLTRKHQRLEIYGLVQFTHYYSRTVDYWPEESVQYEQSHNHTWDQSYWFNISAISPR